MTTQQIKENLLRYRPGTADAEDADFAEALALARQDAELGRWFDDRCKVQTILRRRFEETEVPAGLKEQIISEYRAAQVRRRWRQTAVVTALAACAVLIAVFFLWRQPGSDEQSLSAFGRRMVKTAVKTYGMDVETNDAAAIRAYLAAKKAHADFVVPERLAATAYSGCAVLPWQSRTVSMICFRSGKPLAPGEKSDLFLFVVDQNAVKDAPKSNQPVFAKQNRMTTATWAAGGRVYFLAGNGDEAFLRQYF
ncbi:MAG: hypothetical protein EXS35_19210 [Pedosphaera sp.]|nr:hypothetical protein [Pedosphaera sp.]